ncbi:MAG: methylaspartate mutase, partial [Elusimicrobiota bacterium]|nr:methylaspartate mutase [Elusimicrobiota bacterium]
QSMLMMIDAYQPEGVTRMAVDSIFMMPHLGVLAQISEKAALDVFYHDCLVRLGTCLAPKGLGKEGQHIMDWEVIGSDGKKETGQLRFGDILHVPFASPKARLIAKPVKGFDMGAGSGNRVEAEIEGGVVGLVLDGRGRPFNLSKEPSKRRDDLNKWYKAMGMYPV